MRGILINKTLHTGNDLALVMTSKDLPAPKAQTYTVNVPGRNGALDLSEFLSGEVAYNNRTLDFTFVGDGSRESVLSLIDLMLTYHGQYITVTTDDYPDWYYTGRAEVTYKDNGFYVEITLSMDAQPFRYKLTPKSYSYSAPGEITVTLVNEGKPVTPTIITNGETVITKGGTSYTLSEGTFEPEGLKLERGSNQLIIKSNYDVTITYRERAI